MRPTSDHAESSSLTVVTTVLHVLINIVDVDISTFPLTHPSEFLKVPFSIQNQRTPKFTYDSDTDSVIDTGNCLCLKVNLRVVGKTFG